MNMARKATAKKAEKVKYPMPWTNDVTVLAEPGVYTIQVAGPIAVVPMDGRYELVELNPPVKPGAGKKGGRKA